MKLQTSYNSANRGFTLIEITLVISLILGLIAVLVISITSYKNGADRARCVMNVQAIQKAVRSEANLAELKIGDAFPVASLVPKYFAVMPPCPSYGPNGSQNTYATGAVIPPIGTLYSSCLTTVFIPAYGVYEFGHPNPGHLPKNTTGW